MLTGNIISAIEQAAPPALQEDYDNTGIQVGSPLTECTGVLLCVDVTPETVQEAVDHGCNLIISHHPLIFRGLKRITGSSPVETSVINAIAAGITIYSAHTSLDNASHGVSAFMAGKLGLTDVKVLEPQMGRLMKLAVFVPKESAEEVRLALFDAGAGAIGRYDCCSYSVDGKGTFRALDGADPYVGEIGEYHTEPEIRIEVLLPAWKQRAVEKALLQTHPYEEPAYEFVRIDNADRHTGSGAAGILPAPLTPDELIEKVKAAFGSPVARCTAYPADRAIRRVAMCGGSGSFLIKNAIEAGAQAFITSDTKYHDFVDYRDRILLIDIGHFESEQCTKEIFYHIIKEKFPNFAVRYSEIEKNPIIYK